MTVAAAIGCGVLAIFALITLRALRILGDRIFDYQVYVAMAATTTYLLINGNAVNQYFVALAVLRFVLLLWDLIDLLKLRLTSLPRGRY